MYYVYILENPSRRLYIGQSKDLIDRLGRHNRGGVKYTTNKGPWNVIHEEAYKTREEALQREAYLKSLKSPKYIRAYIIQTKVSNKVDGV